MDFFRNNGAIREFGFFDFRRDSSRGWLWVGVSRKGMTMRQFALALLILFAAPTIAWSDAEDELECEILLRRGEPCVEMVWEENGQVIRGSRAECGEANYCPRLISDGCGCRCTRRAYQDFGFGERIKYQWCKARY